jgi:predicted TIM-barrel fold metal-dependent hydrolase
MLSNRQVPPRSGSDSVTLACPKVGARTIVDTHFHLWDLDENYYPWLSDNDRPSLIKDFSSLRRNYLVADLLRDIGELNVVAGVHVQAEHDHTDVLRETRWLQRVADAPASRGFPQAIVADADFASPEIERILEAHCAFRNVRGIRHALHRRLDAPDPYDPLQDPAWHRNFPLLRKFGLSFDMQLFPRQAEDAVRLIADNPDVLIVFTHAAMPLWSDAEYMAGWTSAMRRYAALPNTAIKISGFGSYDRSWSAQSIAPIVDVIMEAFGPERCMLASNFPVDLLAKSYSEIWRSFAACFASYSQQEQELLFWRNAVNFYRLDLGAMANA